MSELLQEQDREVNSCLKFHLIQMTSACSSEKTVDWKKIFAYLTLLTEYECFKFAINKENMDLLEKSFNFMMKSLSECRKMCNENFKSFSETQLIKLQKIFLENSEKDPINNEFSEQIEIEEEKEEGFMCKPFPIAKSTLKNFKDILEF